ncbi:MAG: hypothetical protein U0414_30005 [Polyangiaceae bacterium]
MRTVISEAGHARPGEIPEADNAGSRALGLRTAACDRGDALACSTPMPTRTACSPPAQDAARADALFARACKLGLEARRCEQPIADDRGYCSPGDAPGE